MSSTIGPINPNVPLRLVPPVTRPQPTLAPPAMPSRQRPDSGAINSAKPTAAAAAKPPISIRFSHKAARLNRLISGKVDKPVTFDEQTPALPTSPDTATGRVRDRLLQAYFQHSGNPAGMNAAGVERESRSIDTQA